MKIEYFKLLCKKLKNFVILSEVPIYRDEVEKSGFIVDTPDFSIPFASLTTVEMTSLLKSNCILKIENLIVLIVLFLSLSNLGYSKATDVNEKVDVVRFDALLKINSTNLLPNSLLFARYWVASDFYSISIIWAEPSLGNFNYPTIFQSFVINSDNNQFSTSSQTINKYSVSVTKPIPERGAFLSSLGSYPIDNLRFAEPEALASRIYKKDIGDINDQISEIKTVEIPDYNDGNGNKREVAKIAYKASDGYIKNLKLINKNNQIFKSIEYQYSHSDGNSILKSQKVVLPEKIMQVGFRGKGATITINSQSQTFTELPGFHHTGGRICNIDYDPVKTNDKDLLVAPSSITVQRGDSNNIMRSAKIYNVEKLKMSLQEVQQAAQEYGRISDDELNIKNLLEKCLLQNPSEIEKEDSGLLVQIRKHFDDIGAKTTSEKLKRISTLINLDWIQSDDKLVEHFRQHLSILKENNLEQIIMYNGLTAIDYTVVLGSFSTADEILNDWLNSFIADIQVNEILNFSQAQMKIQHFWTIYKMLDKCLKSNRNLADNKFDVQVQKTITLYQFYISSKSQNKSRRLTSQIEWASRTIKTDDMPKMITDNIDETERLFDDLKEPTKTQLQFKQQIDKIKETMAQAEK
jgi:hypothetical protein